MATTHEKLTSLLKGRTIAGTQNASDTLTITFTDGSKMTANTAPSNSNSASTGGTITKVRQSAEPPVLSLDGDSGLLYEIPLAKATKSVVLHAKNGTVEYDD